MKTTVTFILLVALAACGVAGAPVAPRTADAAKTGITVSGDARVGVVINP